MRIAAMWAAVTTVTSPHACMSVSLKVPVGPSPDWETKDDGDEEEESISLKSIFDSGAIHHILRQSRNSWLNDIFPKFSSKGKGKNQNQAELPAPPPHTLRFVSKCDVEIGPHIFYECMFYEAIYTPMSISPSLPLASKQIKEGSSQQTSTPGASSSKTPATQTDPPVPSESWKPEITPALIAQVNEAAGTNPILQGLLQSAAKGEASQDQLKTLGFFIQSLAASQRMLPSLSLPSQPSGSTQSFMSAPYSFPRSGVKDPDLIIEFNETRGEKFRIPREIVACEQEITQSRQRDIVMYTFVPFVNDDAVFKKAHKVPKSSTQTVIRLRNASHPLWECIRGWVNEESKKADAWDYFFDKTEECGPRAYPSHRLTESELAVSIQNALLGYPMRPLKPPASGSRSRNRSRPSRSKKATSEAPPAMDVDAQSKHETSSPPPQ